MSRDDQTDGNRAASRRRLLQAMGLSVGVGALSVTAADVSGDSSTVAEGPVENTFAGATVDPTALPEPDRRADQISFGEGSAENEEVPISRPAGDGSKGGSTGSPAASGGGTLAVRDSFDGFGTRDTVRGVDFDDDGTVEDGEVFTVLPPDPQVAAGSDTVVSVINSEIGVFDKTTGERVVDARLEDWFENVLREPATGFFDDYFVFDPRARYDPVAERFYVSCVEFNSVAERGDYLLAVSTTSDPTDPWTNYRITPLRSGGLVDFDQLGFDGEAVYLTQNFFDFDDGEFVGYGGPTLSVLPKSSLLAGADVTAKQFEDLRNPDGSLAFTVQPASMPGYDPGTGDGFYLLNSRFFEGQTLTLWEVSDPTGDVSVSNTAITVEPYNIAPEAPQPDTENKIDTGDARLENVAYDPADGTLWAGHTVDGRSIRWYEIDPAGESVLQTGLFKRNGRSTFFPAVETAGGTTVIVYSLTSGKGGESEAAYPRVEVAGRREGFDASQLEDFAVVREGVSEYDTFTGTDDTGSQTNRWGDYNGVSVDPVDGSFWVVGQYASETDTQATFRTRIANVAFE